MTGSTFVLDLVDRMNCLDDCDRIEVVAACWHAMAADARIRLLLRLLQETVCAPASQLVLERES